MELVKDLSRRVKQVVRLPPHARIDRCKNQEPGYDEVEQGGSEDEEVEEDNRKKTGAHSRRNSQPTRSDPTVYRV